MFSLLSPAGLGQASTDKAAFLSTSARGDTIAAETVAFNDLITLGSQAKAREAGKLRIEGKEYVVQDGDVIEFRFNA